MIAFFIVLLVLLAFRVVYLIAKYSDGLTKLKKDAIALGYARYNPEFGNWEWITKK